MAVSRDGRHWTRPDRTACPGPGLFGAPDGGINSLYGVGMIHRGDEVYQYGQAQGVTHGIFEPGERRGVGAIHRLVQPRDRSIGAVAGPRGGRLLTEPFQWPGGDLTLNLDCGGLGEASVEVRTAEGVPSPGFTHADCDRVDLNQLAAVVTWRGQTTRTLPAGAAIQIDVRLQSSRLYGYMIDWMANT